MDYDLKYTKENLKSYRKQQQQQLKRTTLGSRTVQRILRLVTKKHEPQKKKQFNWISSKFKFFSLQKSIQRDEKTSYRKNIWKPHLQLI